jgi:peptide subunit release factor 1 (eRF1)
MLERLISTDGYGHLVIAGNPRITSAIRRALPKHLAARLVDVVPASADDRITDVVASTLQSFLEHEELESQAIAEELTEQVHRHGLAVAGTNPTLQALKAGQGDCLVLVKAYAPGLGWECRRCHRTETESGRPALCPACGTASLREFDIKCELVRMAEKSDCGVEVVEHSDALMGLGGVGCLLRYLAPASYIPTAA